MTVTSKQIGSVMDRIAKVRMMTTNPEEARPGRIVTLKRLGRMTDWTYEPMPKQLVRRNAIRKELRAIHQALWNLGIRDNNQMRIEDVRRANAGNRRRQERGRNKRR